MYCSQKIFAKFCGLLRIYELQMISNYDAQQFTNDHNVEKQNNIA